MRKIQSAEFKVLETKADLIKAIKIYKKAGGDIVFFDTETTGLNIKYDTPFLLPWGHLDKTNKKQNIGSLTLLEDLILRVKPKIHIFGHFRIKFFIPKRFKI